MSGALLLPVHTLLYIDEYVCLLMMNVLSCDVLSGAILFYLFTPCYMLMNVLSCDVLSGALLLPVLCVNQDGCISTTFEASQSTNDITGGIEFKLRSAADIVLNSGGRIKVLVCSLDSGTAFLEACLYGAWQGTAAASVGTIVQYIENHVTS